MKPCLMDSGFLYALIDDTDRYSIAVKRALESIYEEIVLPIPAITETAYFISKNLGAFAHADFIHGLPEMNVIFEAPTPEDYVRSAEILRKYDDANIDFVDSLHRCNGRTPAYHENSYDRPPTFRNFHAEQLRFVRNSAVDL